jgi:DNA-binding response OmpR family regulator
MLCELFLIEYTVRVYVMAELTMMLFEKGSENNIRCRVVNGWFKIDSYDYTKEKLLSEIKRNRPDVVALNLDLYAKIDGIETSRKIRNQFNVPVIYV